MSSIIEQAKEFVRSSLDRIALDDLVETEILRVVQELGPEKFPLATSPIDPTTISARVEAYEAITADLASIAALIGRWGLAEHLPTLARSLTRLGAVADQTNGSTVWLGLNWLPFFIVHYSAGVAAVAASRYQVLRALYDAPAGPRARSEDPTTAVARAFDGIMRAGRHDVFSALADLQRRPAAFSEYMFGLLTRRLPVIIRIGAELDDAFDRFEVIDTLITYSRQTTEKRVFTPPGRFASKERLFGGSPFTQITTEAQVAAARWAPVEAGLFSGAAEKFVDLATKYRAEYLSRFQNY